MSYRDPRSILEDVFDEEFGLRLLNFSIKPVHVANGLGRALTQRTYTVTPLSKTLRRYVRNQKLGVDQERNPNDAILATYAEAFQPLRGTDVDEARLNRLRSLALDVLGSDGGVYDQPDKSSFTLSNERFLTRDPSDNRAGLFLARLLTAEPKERTDAADRILELLKTESDAWTTLALPLLALTEVRDETGDGEKEARSAEADHLFEPHETRLASETLSALRDAYDRLARFEATAGSKLNSLRRLVLFGCFVIHAHVISRWSEKDPDAPRPPILLDLFDGTMISVRDASRATLRAAGDAIEGLILARFREHVEAEYGETSEDVQSAVDADTELPDSVRTAYRNYCIGGMMGVDALAQSLVDDAFEKAREHPVGAVIELGRRAGFLSPWSNSGRGGKLQKRYTATAEFLETLIAATVEPDEPLEFPEFLDRLCDSFGIVVGRPEDDALIRLNNLRGDQFGPSTTFDEEDLRRNVEEMRKLVVESGYGKAYADGRTILTTRPEGLL
jgi:hypothetical protein